MKARSTGQILRGRRQAQGLTIAEIVALGGFRSHEEVASIEAQTSPAGIDVARYLRALSALPEVPPGAGFVCGRRSG